MKQHFRVALAGNPNCGKTCIFNALTGARQHVGNYPGVTVESKSGKFTLNGMEIELIDLPGVYSLSSSSPEEDVVFQELTKPGIDLIIDVVDSSIPRRSLYLTTQLAELHIPMVLAFNMSDDARRKGFKFDIPKLEKYFGSPIAQTVGSRIGGVKPLLDLLAKTLTELDDHGVPMLTYGADIDDAIKAVADRIEALKVERYAHIPARFFAIKLLEHDTAAMRIEDFKPAMDEVEKQIAHLWDKHAIEADTFMADRRYAMLAGACRDAISVTQERRREISDKIDAVMTNKYLGLPLFFLIIYLTFWFTFTLADPLMGIIEDDIFGTLNDAVKNAWNPETLPFLRSLVTDGVISGVGGVLVFLPNILFLFFAIAILEDSGYMARAAFVMDGIMRKFGLQGRSFVPLVLGFGCSVPAIMATRTIESERDRKTTIMVLPLMSCGARLPIYALIIPAFFVQKYQAFVMWLMYLIGVVIALIAARIMKSTLFKGDGEVYLMELPPYRVPTLRSLLLHMWDRGRMYLQKAGTIILATSIILYICNTYPEKKDFSKNYDAEIKKIEDTQLLTDEQVAVLDAASKTEAFAEIFGEDVMKEVKENKVVPDDALEALGEMEDLELARSVQSLLAEYRDGNAKAGEPQLLTDEQIAVLEDAAKNEAFAKILTEDVMKEVREKKAVPDGALKALDKTEDLKLAEAVNAAQERADAIAALENEQMAEAMEYTISGRVGHALEPVFRPIGFDWKLTTASIGALAAKEVFVAQLGILYSEGEADEESVPLREQLVKNYTPLQGFCIMLFCLLSIPCLATLAIIRRELNSWSMPFIEAGGLLALAYILTMIVYQAGSALHIGITML